jgi:hypothetical protein
MRLTIDRERLDDRRQLLAEFDGVKRRLDTSGVMDDMDRMESQAYDVILRGAADAFDLSREPSTVVARYDTAPLVRPENIVKSYESSKYYIDNAKTLVQVQATFFRFAGSFLGGSVCWRCFCWLQP